jgi:hypothetical protein
MPLELSSWLQGFPPKMFDRGNCNNGGLPEMRTG